MAYQGINTGTSPNSGTGDSLIVGGQKINSNFLEIYNVIGDGSDLFVGVVTQISAGTNVSISTAYGAVQVSAPTPSNISATNLNITGITTLGSSNGIGTVTIGTGSTALYVDGNARIVGVLTVGSTSIVLDGDNNLVNVGSAVTIDGQNSTLYMGDSITLNATTGIITANSLVIGNNEFTGAGNTFNTLTITGISTLTGDVSCGSSILIGDDKKIVLGDNDEFQLYHNDSDGNVIRDEIGNLNILSDSTNFKSGTGTTEVLLTNTNSEYNVELYYNGTKRFDTRPGGVRVNGNLSVSGVSTLGIITGATYYGNGSNLSLTGADGSGMTGVVTTLTGADASGVTGITTLIQAGTNISVTTNSGISTISYTGVANTSNINADSIVVSGVSTLGVVTGATYYGDGSEVADVRWDIGANGSSDYTYTGIGFTQTTNDPILYLLKGNVYEFENNSGGGHPFQIRLSNGGSAYSDGVTNNGAASGIIRFEVPFNAPETLYYQCTNHSGMGNTIYTVGRNTNISADSLTISGVSTLGVITATNQYNTGIVTAVGGFVSAASTQGVQITFSGTTLTFTVAGIGSTNLILS